MRSLCWKIYFCLLAMPLGLLSYFEEVAADPAGYPQFAQQHLPQGVAPEFIYLSQLVDDIVKGKRPFIIDVRSVEEYQEAHIKASVSIPLSEVRLELEKIPKDRAVVLY